MAYIEEILPEVKKPSRYVGNEWNSVHKKEKGIKIALAFPDLYEIGMSHLGMNILYHLLNAQAEITAERVYAVWLDMEKKLREKNIPLFSMESRTALKEFDVIGFSLQYEMGYTNMLNMLDLSGIPLRSQEREENYPLIIAGGSCAFNPEPISSFVDLFVLGEAEEVILEIIQVCREIPPRKKGNKQKLLRQLAKIRGVYVPSFYQIEYCPDQTIRQIRPLHTDIPSRVEKRFIADLAHSFYPLKPILPYQNIVHDHLPLEIMRGCPRACHFCQARSIYHPLRTRPASTLKKIAMEALKNTGWEEISLLSLNTPDYPEIEKLITSLQSICQPGRINITLPSLRPDSFSLKLGQAISPGNKAVLTFAPEAGTQRLRDSINKRIEEGDLIKSVLNGIRLGWKAFKLYFMLGLPGERDEDIEGIIRLVQGIKREGGKAKSHINLRLNLSPFVPKSHTPFQWQPMERREILAEKQKKILRDLKKVEIRWHNPYLSFLEGVFSRGDRRLNDVVFKAWQKGARFDAWEECFRFSLWEEAFNECGVDPSFYLYRKRDQQEVLPWNHLKTGADPI